MIRFLCLLFCFLVSSISHADTYNAVKSYPWNGVQYTAVSSWFDGWKQSQNTCTSGSTSTVTCTFTSSTPYNGYDDVVYHRHSVFISSGAVSDTDPHVTADYSWACPNGGTLALSGGVYVCNKSCTAPQVLGLDGVCASPCEGSQIRKEGSSECVCDPEHLKMFPSQYGEYMEGSGSMPDSACVGGCMRKTGDFCLGGGTKWWCSGGAWTTQKCSGGPTDTKMPDNKKPPCSGGDGVMTSSSGRVMCVPEGTPDMRKPDVQKSESKQTAPNGDVTVTDKTTTKDPATGATATTTTTTTTAAAGGSTSATTETNSGASGMTGGTGDNSGNEPGECAKEPDSPMCKKGTVKDKGKFDNEQDAKLTEAKQQLTDKFNQIKEQLSAAFQSSAGVGGGTLPCPPSVDVLGKQISFCVQNYADQLSPIGAIIVFAAAIIAILLVVTA